MALDKSTNNPQEEFEFAPVCIDYDKNERSRAVQVTSMYDFKNVIEKAASKGENGLRLKKKNLIALKANV